MSIAGQFAEKSRAITTHSDNYEMLLIRVGHHLWRARKQALKTEGFTAAHRLMLACESVWAAKAEYRKPFLARDKANKQASAQRLRKQPV